MIPLISGAVSALAAAREVGGGGGGGGLSPVSTGDKKLSSGIFQVGKDNNATAVETSPEKAKQILESSQPFSTTSANYNSLKNYLIIGGVIIAASLLGYLVLKINKK